jgi:hypothetical protein
MYWLALLYLVGLSMARATFDSLGAQPRRYVDGLEKCVSVPKARRPHEVLLGMRKFHNVPMI